jgi:hypothetical protein
VTHSVIYPRRLVDIDVEVSDTIRPTTAQRDASIGEVNGPKNALTHVDLKGGAVGPARLLVQAELEGETAGDANHIVGGIGLVGADEVQSLEGVSQGSMPAGIEVCLPPRPGTV